MKVALDYTLGGHGRGGNKYTSALLESLNKYTETTMIPIAVRGRSSVDVFNWIPGRIKPYLWPSTMADGVRIGPIASWAIRNPDIIHSVGFQMVSNGRARTVFTVFDLPWRSGFSCGDYLRPQIESGLRRADLLVAISHFTERQVMAQLEEWSIQKPVKVIYPCVSERFLGVEGTRPHGIDADRKFLLYVGATDSQNKNFSMVVQAARETDMLLVIAGPERPQDTEESQKVSYLGRVSEDELVWLYDNAVAVLYPSLFEGFGYPIAEAEVRGCPVITSDFGAMKEIGGDFTIHVDPRRIEDIVSAIYHVATDSDERRQTKKPTLSSSRFWPVTIAKAWKETYLELLES